MPDLDQPPWRGIFDAVRDDILPVFVIVIATLIAVRLCRIFVHGLVKALFDREATVGTAQDLSAVELKKRLDTVETFGTNSLQFLIVVIAGLMILGQLGLDIGPAIAGLGIVGIAVGFGAQSLVRDYLNGALILIENQFARGDVIKVAGVSGTVEDFTLRRTTLRDLDGAVHTIPNGEIRVASNLTRVWARINQDVTVVYGTDVDQATVVVDTVGRTMAGDPVWAQRVLDAPRVERVEALGEAGITLKILGTVRAADRWAAAGEFRKRLLDALTAAGIAMAGEERAGPPPGPDTTAADAPPPDPNASAGLTS